MNLDREKARTVRRCMASLCPGLDAAVPMHEVEWGPEYHDYCRRLLVAEARLARIATECDERDPHDRYAPAVVPISVLRAILA